MLRKLLPILSLLILLVGLAGCTFPGLNAPTPFVFPTPNLTLTAIFAPTQAAPGTPAANPGVNPTATTGSAAPTAAAPQPSATAAATQAPPSATQAASTATQAPPTNTQAPPPATQAPPTNTPKPTAVSYEGPGSRNGPSMTAYLVKQPPTIDGSLEEWTLDRYSVDSIVYGGGNWAGPQDLSAKVMWGWDADRLYLAARVKDDVYVQNATAEEIFKGDGLDILFDIDVPTDFYRTNLNSDDFQIGISPGQGEPGVKPEAYIWNPQASAGSSTKIKIGAMRVDDGYRIEVAIPWSLLPGYKPRAGKHLGLALSVSDNDRAGSKLQQSMVSFVPNRDLTNPTTWGDLTLSGVTMVPAAPAPKPTATTAPTPAGTPGTEPGAQPGPTPNPQVRSAASLAAAYVANPPVLDGTLGEWTGQPKAISNVVYGANAWVGPSDLSGSVMAAWDASYLYLGVQVTDDHYFQNASGKDLFLGDSLEVLLDAALGADFSQKSLSGDDYQLGISPGSPNPGASPQAYLWFPAANAGARSQVRIASAATSDGGGYTVEVAIPWGVFGVSPTSGLHFGFALSLSDNDGAPLAQQSMVSNVPNRVLTDPTTWGDLVLQ